MWDSIVFGTSTFAITMLIAIRWIRQNNELHSYESYRMSRDTRRSMSDQSSDSAPPRRAPTPEEVLAKARFYAGKTVKEVYWFLSSCDLPDTLCWARLRVFDDGSADSTFSEDGWSFGFVEERYASYILTEDEYVCFSTFDDEDDASYGINRHEITPPDWVDPTDKPLEFLGTY